jgi:hypothetical protein
MLRRSSIALITAIGCQGDPEIDDAPPLAAFAPLCGERGPVQLLALAENEKAPAPPVLAPSEDRLVHVVHVSAPDHEKPNQTRIDLRSTGPCGENPAIMFEDAAGVEEHGFSRPFVCDKIGRALLLSPSGSPPQVLFENTGCDAWALGSGAVGLVIDEDATMADVVFRASFSAPVEHLARAVSDPEKLASKALVVVDPEIFFVNGDDRLVALDVSDRTESILEEGIRAFDVSEDGRFVLLQHDEPFTEGLASFPLEVLDRQTGDRIELGWGDLARGDGSLGEGFAWAYADPALGGVRVVVLPELDALLLGQGRFPLARLSDAWLALRLSASHDGGVGLSVVDRTRGDDVATFRWGAGIYELDGGFDVVSTSGPSGIALWHWNPATSTTELVASIFGAYQRISAHQVALYVEDEPADLYVLDRRTARLRLVDRDASLGGRLRSLPEEALGPGSITYGIEAADRRGVWAARLLPDAPR